MSEITVPRTNSPSDYLLSELDKTLRISGVQDEFTSYLQKDVSMPYAGAYISEPGSFILISSLDVARNEPQLRGSLEVTRAAGSLAFKLANFYTTPDKVQKDYVETVGFPRVMNGTIERSLHGGNLRVAAFVVEVHLEAQAGHVSVADAEGNWQSIAAEDLSKRGTMSGGGFNNADIVFNLARAGVRALSNPRRPDLVY